VAESMEDYNKKIKQSQNHSIYIQNRSEGTITGVEEVNEFDNNQISLNTSMGCVMIKGRDLKVKRLNLEKGEVDVTGNVDSFSYTTKKSNESLLKRMFQ
jgi:sporulation protein YabP